MNDAKVGPGGRSIARFNRNPPTLWAAMRVRIGHDEARPADRYRASRLLLHLADRPGSQSSIWHPGATDACTVRDLRIGHPALTSIAAAMLCSM
jgi:hypothetical protein